MTPMQKLEKIKLIYNTETPMRSRSIMSTHIRDNLLGAYIRMKRTGKADGVCLETIERIMTQLAEIEKVLGI